MSWYFTILEPYVFLLLNYCEQNVITRMHSSRMCTVRCSGRHLGGDVCQGGCLNRRGVCPGGVSAWGVFAWGCLPDIPLDRMTDTCKNITLLQLRCGR